MRLKREVVSKGQGERNSSQNLGKQKSRKLKSYCGYYLPRASFLLLRGKAISTGSKYGFITLKKKTFVISFQGTLPQEHDLALLRLTRVKKNSRTYYRNVSGKYCVLFPVYFVI